MTTALTKRRFKPKIPRARAYLKEALTHKLDPDTRRLIRRALSLMRREPALKRKVRSSPVCITPHLRRRIMYLLDNTDMTMHRIATIVGVNNSGRISEVAHGKR